MYLVSYLLSGRTSLMVKNNTSLEINDLPQDQMLCVFHLISVVSQIPLNGVICWSSNSR